jgi:hypothetical protein
MNMSRHIPIAFAIFLSACAQTEIRQRSTAADSAAVDERIGAQVSCGRKYVVEVDDGTSDATTIALALALRCRAEYGAATEAIAATLDNDAQRRMLRQRREAREERVESFLPLVVQYRRSRKGA